MNPPLDPAAEIARLRRRQQIWTWVAVAGVILTVWAWFGSPLCRAPASTSAPGASPAASPHPSAIVDFVDSTPLAAAVYPNLSAGDTVGHFVYATDPTLGTAPLLVGTTYRTSDGTVVQRWRQTDFWPGADTIWVWEGIRLSGDRPWTARTITKFLPSDPEWGLVIESNQSECRPRIGADWRKTILPFVALGSAFSHLVRR